MGEAQTSWLENDAGGKVVHAVPATKGSLRCEVIPEMPSGMSSDSGEAGALCCLAGDSGSSGPAGDIRVRCCKAESQFLLQVPGAWSS